MNAPEGRIRILVVDDHTLFRRGLTALLGCDAALQVVGDAGDAGEAQRKAEALKPDVTLELTTRNILPPSPSALHLAWLVAFKRETVYLCD